MAGKDIFLWWGSGSAPCWKVMITLEEKALQGYEQKLISFEKKEHKTEEMMKINPRGQVPVFKHKDLVICESQAACDYLEENFKDQGSKLMPDEPEKRAMVLQRKYESFNLHKKGSEDLITYLFRMKPELIDEKLLKAKKEAYKQELQLWEKYLEELGDGSYIADKDFSMADISLFPTLAFHVRLGLDFENFPRLGKYYNQMCERPSIKSTWPPHWKENEGKNIIGEL